MSAAEDRLAAAVARASETNAVAPPTFLVEDSDGAPRSPRRR